MEIHLAVLVAILVCVLVMGMAIGEDLFKKREATPRTPPDAHPVQSLVKSTLAPTERSLDRFAIPPVASDVLAGSEGTSISFHTYTDASLTLANQMQPQQTEW